MVAYLEKMYLLLDNQLAGSILLMLLNHRLKTRMMTLNRCRRRQDIF